MVCCGQPGERAVPAFAGEIALSPVGSAHIEQGVSYEQDMSAAQGSQLPHRSDTPEAACFHHEVYSAYRAVV